MKAVQEVYFPGDLETDQATFNHCLGWFEYNNKEIPGTSFLFHNGGTGGYNSDFFIQPEEILGLVLLFNNVGDTEGREEMITEFLMLLF